RYKWWILSILALLLVGGAIFMLRKQSPAFAGLPGGVKAEGDADSFVAAPIARVQTDSAQSAYASSSIGQQPRASSPSPGNANATLMSSLKDEL
uniref:hypothetical protein n=1 Tax=Salmonella sp. SAL04284 TaxID=3159862 RepID=UPI00397B892F